MHWSTHWVEGIAGVGLGVVVMIGMSWLSGRWETASEKNDRRIPSLLIVAGAGVTIAGVLIGSGDASLGFSDGFRWMMA